MASEEEKEADAAAAEECDGDIHEAARKGNLAALRHCLRADPGSVGEKDRDGRTPLHKAASDGHVAAAEFLLSKGAAVDATENYGQTPLYSAAFFGKVEAAELLLSKGAAVDATDNSGRTPLHWAWPHVAAAELLLSKGAAVDATDKSGRTPLHWAAYFGKVEAAELLLSKGAAVDATDKSGRMPLHWAAHDGRVAAAEFLLSKGAAVDATDNRGKTPLDVAREGRYTKMERFLLNSNAKKALADDGKTPQDGKEADAAAAEACGGIHEAARKGNLPGLRHFLHADPGSMGEKTRHGRTPLHFAANYGHIEAAEFLLSKGAAVDATDNRGWTPLHVAARWGQVAAAELLISKGAAVDATNINGQTPLHLAALNGHVAAAEFLLSKGAAVDAKGNDGRTPLHLAASQGEVKAAEFLLSKGATLDATDNNGKTPLDVAREKRYTKMEQSLLNPHAKKASADDGTTPPDLSSKGQAEKEPLPTAADKPSEAGKKAEQTPVFPFSSPRRQTSKEDAAPHAAGSGAVAVKHRRETSKEEAAKALKKAMESGNVEVLKEAIAAAKAEKVSPEDILEAMEKLMALKESADQRELSPAEEAAKALKKAMESGNVEVLKEAIAAAKAEKVSPEDILEATEKLMALRESAATSKAGKSVTTSKAESFVKLEPGHGARLAMFSARFNERNKDTENKFRAVRKLLVENHYEVLMVEAGAGESFGELTAEYLTRLQSENGIMLAVCTSDYGEMTESSFSSYYELKYAKAYNLDVLPLQVEEEWKPKPPCGEGHRDAKKSALAFISMVFHPDIVRIDCRSKSIEAIASEIAAVLRKQKPA